MLLVNLCHIQTYNYSLVRYCTLSVYILPSIFSSLFLLKVKKIKNQKSFLQFLLNYSSLYKTLPLSKKGEKKNHLSK